MEPETRHVIDRIPELVVGIITYYLFIIMGSFSSIIQLQNIVHSDPQFINDMTLQLSAASAFLTMFLYLVVGTYCLIRFADCFLSFVYKKCFWKKESAT